MPINSGHCLPRFMQRSDGVNVFHTKFHSQKNFNMPYKSLTIPRFSFAVAIILIGFPVLIVLKGAGADPTSPQELLIFSIILVMFSVSLMKSRVELIGLAAVFALTMIVFIGYQLLLVLTVEHVIAGFISIIIHDKYMLLAFIVPFLFQNNNDDKYIIYIILSIALVVCAKLMLDVIVNGSFMQLYGHGGFARQRSIFPNTNMLGMFIVGVLPLAVLAIQMSNKAFIRLMIYIFVMLPILISLLMTFSRRAWVAAIVIASMYLMSNFKVKNIFYIVVFFLLIAAISDYTVFIDRLLLIFDPEYRSNFKRLNTAENSLNQILYSYSTLIGGNGIASVGPASDLIPGSDTRVQVDSYFLQLMLETGVAGIFIFFTMFSLVLIMGYMSYKRYNNAGSQKRFLVQAYSLIIISYMISGTVGNTIIAFPTNCYLWLFSGLIIKHYLITESVTYNLQKT